jgi:hypothetical protein
MPIKHKEAVMNKYSIILLALLLLCTGVNASPITWEDNGHSYDIVSYDHFLSWQDARDEAFSMGGHLATITDAQENDFIWNLVKNTNSPKSFWLGGSDHESEGTWKWVTGETWDYDNWYSPNEPNNGVGGTQHYLHFWPGSGVWDDMENGRYMTGYIIEYDQNPVPEPTTMLLFGFGLLGLSGLSRIRKQ